jgi:hypothetical protein
MADVFVFTVRTLLLFVGFTRPNLAPSASLLVFTSWNVPVHCEPNVTDYFNGNSHPLVSSFYERLPAVTYLQSPPCIAADIYRTRTLLLWSRMTNSLPYRPRPTGSRRASFVAVLLLLAGDIEFNPGPRSAVPTADQLTVSIKVGILNCCSAANKIALIHDLIADRQLDALFLSETWFTTDTPASILDDVAPPHYAALHVPRPLVPGGPSRGGGLAVIYRQTLVVRRHPLADKYRPTTFEMQLVRVGLPPLTHAVINIYRPQWMSSVPEFIDELDDIIASLGVECTDNIVLCGDLNCPGVDGSHVDAGLETTLDSLGLTQFVNSTTRCTSLLDVLASSSTALVSNVNVDDAGRMYDHCLVTANITTRSPKPTVAYSWRKLRDVDPMQFESALRQSELFTSPAVTTDEFAEQFARVVTDELDEFAPIRNGFRRPPKPISK